MKKIALFLILASGLILPLACTNSAPTGPLATFNLTATFTSTVTLTPTNWAGYTSTATRVPGVTTNTSTMTATVTNTQTVTNTFTPSNTPSLPTPVLTNGPFSTNEAPNGVAYDGSVTIYVAEGTVGSTNGEIQMFNSTGSVLGSTMTTYDGTHTFGQPNGVVYYGGNIYVVDQVNNAVYEINPSNNNLVNSVTTWTATAGGPSSFLNPEGIAVDSNGNIYIADTGNDYVEVFSSSLAILSGGEFGGSGSGNGQFNNPAAVAVTVASGPSTIIYVADASNQIIQQFNGTYTYVSQFSTGLNSDVFGITLDASGNIYTADSGQNQVIEYNSSGSFLTAGLGISPSNDPSPDAVAFIGSNLLVADYNNNALYLVTP